MTTKTRAEEVRERVTAGVLLRESLTTAHRGGVAVVALAFATNVVLLLAGRRLISFLFREALLLSGESGVDLADLSLSASSLLSVVLLLAIGLLSFVMVAAQLAMILIAIRQVGITGGVNVHGLISSIRTVVRKLFRRSSIPMFLYLFFLLPVSGLGFFSTLTQVIAVPNFVSGELLKNPVTAVLWHVLMLVILWVNIRFALALPLFLSSEATGGHALRLSWRAMRGRQFWALVVSAIAVLVPAIVLAVVIALASVVPTLITDHTAPALSAVSAAFSMAIAQIVLLLVLSTVTVLLLAVLATLADLVGASPDARTPRDATYPAEPWRWGLIIGATALVVPLQLSLMQPVHALSNPPDTVVLAHRGFVAGGVENTIPALEAAAAVGADRVEMDVMQTKDGQFVVIHDFNLARLAGRDVDVKDLTLAELTSVTVHDRAGHTATIPSLEQYVTRARELDMPLLIEVKMGGLDTPDHVDRLVRQLDDLGALEGNSFHSLDHGSVERLKELLPDTEVGYILPFSGVGIPETSADFLVIEEYTATDAMHLSARKADLGFYVWTVDDALAQRVRFRGGVDAIITDRPDSALQSRDDIRSETGLTPALLDLMLGFVVL